MFYRGGIEMNCSTHNLVPARLQCAECGRALCEHCIRTIDVQRQKIYVCSHCGGRTVSPHIMAELQHRSASGGFAKEILSVLIYPAKGTGLVTIIIGTIFFFILGFITQFSFFGLFIGVIIGGYLFKYYSTVVQLSAKGKNTPPTWSEVEFLDMGDLARTFFRTIFVCLISFGLPFVYLFNTENVDPVLYVLFGISFFYFPMAFLAVNYYESIEALNPKAVFISISRAFGGYFVVVIVFYILLGLDWGIIYALGLQETERSRSLLEYSPLAVIVHRFISLYLFTGMMHLLGAFYYYHKEELGWQ